MKKSHRKKCQSHDHQRLRKKFIPGNATVNNKLGFYGHHSEPKDKSTMRRWLDISGLHNE